MNTLFTAIILTPIVEYTIHLGLHLIKNKTHKNHHTEVHTNNNRIERLPLIIAYICLYMRYYIIGFGFLQYWMIHSLIHFYPQYLPKYIVRHHLNHHKNPSVCFAICAPCIDVLFGTDSTILSINDKINM